MTAKARTIEIDSDTADLLDAWAEERGLTVAELLAELTAAEQSLPPNWEQMRKAGRSLGARDFGRGCAKARRLRACW
jgi:hypothetical protein